MSLRFIPLAIASAALVASAAACGRSTPDYPIVETSKPMSAYAATIPGRAPAVAGGVTAERITQAREEPENWLTYYGAYDGQRYSTLDQLTRANVRQLRPAWVFQTAPFGLVATPATYSQETTPLVVDGVMYATGADGFVWALDAATGKVFWRYHHSIPLDVPLCCGNVNRGAAVAEGKVFVATANGHLLALDAETGQPVWDKLFVDVRAGESATLAPLVVKDRVLVGSSGGEYGVRGHIDAFALDDGERLWRLYPVPKPGEPGSETWETKDAWQRGGGTAWITGSYDPELDLVYWGTGNPGPDFDGSAREGDNLFTNSIIAFDPDDGKIRWHYQTTPHDQWDFDGVNEQILFEQDGRRLLAHFDRNGYLFVLDRTDGRLVRATQFADSVTWGTIDTAGQVTVELEPTAEGIEICPSPSGAKEWPHAAYSPRTGLLYTPMIQKCGTFTTAKTEFKESLPYWGGGARASLKGYGAVKAIDPLTGRTVWESKRPLPMVGSAMVTAGDLVFIGEPTGELDAFDARTGELLWQFQTGSGIHASPVTYTVDGKQYVAIASGWGGWLKGFAPEMYGAQRGGAIVVFALP